LMTILAISLIELPPTAGFVAKFLVFSNLWEYYTQHSDKIFLILFVWGLINTVISLFYYLKIPFYMFFKTADPTVSVQINKSNLILVSALCVPLIILFLKFDWLLDFVGQLN
jgi:NADH-quinone oxidoreductase subunit N